MKPAGKKRNFELSASASGATNALKFLAIFIAMGMMLQTHLANAQAFVPPTIELSDKNHVDFASRGVDLSVDDVTIGFGNLTLAHTTYPVSGIYTGAGDSFSGMAIPLPANEMTVWLGGQSEVFPQPASGQTVNGYLGNGDTLTLNSNGTYTEVLRDGTIISYSTKSNSIGKSVAQQITYPDGRILFINYGNYLCTASSCNSCTPSACISGSGINDYRIQSITSNFGLQLKYIYPTTNYLPQGNQPSQVVAINNAVDYCDPIAIGCSYSTIWPTSNMVWPAYSNQTVCSNSGLYNNTISITDSAGGLASLTMDAIGRVTSLKESQASTPNLQFTWNPACNANPTITGVTRSGTAWTYARNTNSSAGTTTYKSTNPVSAVFVANGDGTGITSLNNPDGSVVTYTDDSATRIASITKPEGGSTAFTYDARGNLTQKVETPKTGSSQPSRTSSAGYDAACGYPAKCNKPNWIKDWNGNETDFTYNTTTGQVLTITYPAGASGIRPQVRYIYASYYAWFKTASGTIAQASSPISLLSQTSTCRTGAPASSGVGCAVAGDEVITSYQYGQGSSAKANNLWLRGVTVDQAGLALTTCFAYDAFGNTTSKTTPNAKLTSCP